MDCWMLTCSGVGGWRGMSARVTRGVRSGVCSLSDGWLEWAVCVSAFFFLRVMLCGCYHRHGGMLRIRGHDVVEWIGVVLLRG